MNASWWTTSWDFLSVERRTTEGRPYALVTLADPRRRNMMSEPMTNAWRQLMPQLAADADLGAVVVTGEGSAFCAGGDLSWITSAAGLTVESVRARMHTFYRDWLGVRTVPVPTIAAINGHAIGAGLGIALACDVRVVAATARLSAPFTQLGIHPGMGTTWLLREVAGDAVARDLLLTGRTISGSEACELGLASRLADTPEDTLAEACDAAEAICSASPQATRLCTEAVRVPALTLEAAVQREALAQGVTMTGPDLPEGMAAAREKRPPRFAAP